MTFSYEIGEISLVSKIINGLMKYLQKNYAKLLLKITFSFLEIYALGFN